MVHGLQNQATGQIKHTYYNLQIYFYGSISQNCVTVQILSNYICKAHQGKTRKLLCSEVGKLRVSTVGPAQPGGCGDLSHVRPATHADDTVTKPHTT